MTLEVLLSCMHETDDRLVRQSHISGDAVVISQGDWEGETNWPTAEGTARFLFTRDRGLTKSRNLAIQHARADVCLLCDDDEVFQPDYRQKILSAYEDLPQADVIIFKMVNQPTALPERVMELKFPRTIHVSSWQISFRRESLLRSGVRFDEFLGAGTGNGAEEEMKFLLDCQRAGLRIFYVPAEIASVAQTESTWFSGFNREFFYNRGATTRYIMGFPLAVVYALYYAVRKRSLYRRHLTMPAVLGAMLRGMWDNKIKKQAAAVRRKSSL